MKEEIKFDLNKDTCDNPLVELIYDLKTRADTYKYPKYAIPFLGAYAVNKQYVLDAYEEKLDAYYKHRESHVYPQDGLVN